MFSSSCILFGWILLLPVLIMFLQTHTERWHRLSLHNCPCLSLELSSKANKHLSLINIFQCGDTPMDNKCAFLRLLIALDSKPSRLSDQSIVKISRVLPQYLINVVTVCTSPSNFILRSLYIYYLNSYHKFI